MFQTGTRRRSRHGAKINADVRERAHAPYIYYSPSVRHSSSWLTASYDDHKANAGESPSSRHDLQRENKDQQATMVIQTYDHTNNAQLS
jgi:hypothetical protein